MQEPQGSSSTAERVCCQQQTPIALHASPAHTFSVAGISAARSGPGENLFSRWIWFLWAWSNPEVSQEKDPYWAHSLAGKGVSPFGPASCLQGFHVSLILYIHYTHMKQPLNRSSCGAIGEGREQPKSTVVTHQVLPFFFRCCFSSLWSCYCFILFFWNNRFRLWVRASTPLYMTISFLFNSKQVLRAWSCDLQTLKSPTASITSTQ